MENEKLQEARKTFDEDVDRFRRYMAEMEAEAEKAKIAAEEAKGRGQERNMRLE